MFTRLNFPSVTFTWYTSLSIRISTIFSPVMFLPIPSLRVPFIVTVSPISTVVGFTSMSIVAVWLLTVIFSKDCVLSSSNLTSLAK